MNSKDVGERSEAQVLARFLQKGWIVLQPFGDNQRYDFVIDRGNGFERVQVKTAVVKNGAIRFMTCSSYGHRGRGKRAYRGECELFVAWSNELQKAYMIDVNQVGITACSLRLEPSKNKQTKGIRLAKDFEI